MITCVDFKTKFAKKSLTSCENLHGNLSRQDQDNIQNLRGVWLVRFHGTRMQSIVDPHSE